MNIKAIMGLTPKEYAAAHRAKRVRNELGRSGTVTEKLFSTLVPTPTGDSTRNRMRYSV